MRELALDHAGSRVADAVYLDRMAELRAQLAALDARTAGGTPASRAVEWLEILAETWQRADVPEEKSDGSCRVRADRRSRAGVRRCPAHTRGLLPRIGTRAARGCDGAPDRCWARTNSLQIPIEGRDEWLAAARRLA